MGSSLGPHWHSDRASSTEKIKKKIQVRYIHPLKITYLSPGAKYTLRRLFPWVLCAACMIQNPPPYRASFRARIRGLCSWISCKYRQRCPMGRSSMSWFFFFFFLPYLSYFECKRRNQRQTLSQKEGEKCAYLPSSWVIYQSALCAAAHGAPISLCLSHLDLHFVYYIQHPGAAVAGMWPEQMCLQEIFICQAGPGVFVMQRFPLGVFLETWKNCVFPIKTVGGLCLTGSWKFWLLSTFVYMKIFPELDDV